MIVNIDKINKVVCESKMGLYLLFPENFGEYVIFSCKFDKLGYDFEIKCNSHACIKNITKDGITYNDIDENGLPVNHIWLKNIAHPQFNNYNQSHIWNKLSSGDELEIGGTLWFYDCKKSNCRKIAIINAKILSINGHIQI